ncbi:MAG: tRNA (N6-isopentenyl adenosine(37)-C2)-methylthiotransferase MiaB [Acidimicrobiia bacterium]|nr:tRNA (N6-isopentenyl adenosine(37)-C2)-methylthiotransferase MiaB [Acidimicrobiia bacterium]MCY4435298.1 tRNA (N6-isopentenyl adenosine(37)-C2)-methylthiotransferase MiaB [bacterium]
MSRSYFIRTYGCQMNEHDTERIAGLLEADGMTSADAMESADVIVLNTCCIRENADNKLYGQLGHLKRLKQDRPDMQIAVAGCLAQKDRELIRERAGHVDVVFGTHNVHRAAELIGASADGPIVEILEEAVEQDRDSFPSALPVRREAPYAAWMTIQVGCDNSCAFCIVPAVRGAEISRPLETLVSEAADLVAGGVTEITLLGQNVNSYGRDLQRDRRQAGERVPLRPLFADLLRAVGAVDGIERIRFTSPHPKDLRPETIEAMAEVPSVCEHLHLPLQSGSDRVLAAMHRGYTAERYLERLRAARDAVDDLAVSTDIIVGFPGETEDDFEQTLLVAAEAEYDSAFTFVFSPRPGTEAAEMADQYCDPDEVRDRFERLRAVVERSSRRGNQARVGRREEVVVEGPSKKDPAVLTGRSRQNRLVHFPSPEKLKPGTFATVDVTEAGAHHLRGELAEVTAPPRWRTRIPVAAL